MVDNNRLFASILEDLTELESPLFQVFSGPKSKGKGHKLNGSKFFI